MAKNVKKLGWARRQSRVRRHLRGDTQRPRLNVYRSEKHIYAQVIDDTSGSTMAAASTLSPEFRALGLATSDIAAATKVGELLATKALARSIKSVVFDRNGFLYHGRVKAVAEGARKAGLDF